MSITINGTEYRNETEAKLGQMFDELVPDCGKAETVAGEIVRAIGRIDYRYFNDGDMIGKGYGKETCNPAARYLGYNTNDEVRHILELLGETYMDDDYMKLLNDLDKSVLEYLENHPELKETENKDDMWEYKDDKEDVDDSWLEEDEDDWD